MIKVIKPGFYASIQDLGRFGYRDIGVPLSGVMDSLSANKANGILGNNANLAVLEIALGGTVLLFEKEMVICITGANFDATINQEPVSMNQTLLIKAGDQLSFGFCTNGSYGYLGILGGIKTAKKLGSRSYYKGITARHILMKNEVLPVKFDEQSLNKSRSNDDKVLSFDTKIIEVYKGPEFDLLETQQKSLLLNSEILLSKDCNRMGYRLESPLKSGLPSILSSAVLPGTVQCTPSGNLMVLMRDAQVTGGYTRLFQLTEMAINLLAQKRPGELIMFKLLA